MGGLGGRGGLPLLEILRGIGGKQAGRGEGRVLVLENPALWSWRREEGEGGMIITIF